MLVAGSEVLSYKFGGYSLVIFFIDARKIFRFIDNSRRNRAKSNMLSINEVARIKYGLMFTLFYLTCAGEARFIAYFHKILIYSYPVTAPKSRTVLILEISAT